MNSECKKFALTTGGIKFQIKAGWLQSLNHCATIITGYLLNSQNNLMR